MRYAGIVLKVRDKIGAGTGSLSFIVLEVGLGYKDCAKDIDCVARRPLLINVGILE